MAHKNHGISSSGRCAEHTIGPEQTRAGKAGQERQYRERQGQEGFWEGRMGGGCTGSLAPVSLQLP